MYDSFENYEQHYNSYNDTDPLNLSTQKMNSGSHFLAPPQMDRSQLSPFSSLPWLSNSRNWIRTTTLVSSFCASAGCGSNENTQLVKNNWNTCTCRRSFYAQLLIYFDLFCMLNAVKRLSKVAMAYQINSFAKVDHLNKRKEWPIAKISWKSPMLQKYEPTIFSTFSSKADNSVNNYNRWPFLARSFWTQHWLIRKLQIYNSQKLARKMLKHNYVFV